MSATGKCLCGAVTFTAKSVDRHVHACHCSMCRGWAGGPLLAARAESVAFTGEDAIKRYASSDWAERGFCPTCGSSLFWRLTLDGPAKGLTLINTGSLDDMSGLEFSNEVYVDHNPGNYAFAGDRPRMTEAEVMAMVNAGDPS